MGVPEHFNLPWLLALDDGAFAEVGVDLEWTDAPGGTGEMSQALFHGETDMALLLTEGAVTSILTGNPCHIRSAYVDSPLIWGVFTGVGGAKAPDGRAGAPFVISRFYSGSHLMAFVYADRLRRKVSKTDFVLVGNVDGAEKALAENPDQLFLWEKNITLPYVDRKKMNLIDECSAPWPAFVLVVRNDLPTEKLEAIDRAMKVVRTYAEDLEESEEEGAELVAHLYDMSIKQANDWLQQVKFSRTGKVDPATLSTVADTLHHLGVLESAPDNKQIEALLNHSVDDK